MADNKSKENWTLKERFKHIAESVTESEISEIPGPLAELVALYVSKEWLINHKLHLKSVFKPLSIFLNILLPNKGLGKIITKIQSDFWPDLDKEFKKKMESKDDPETRPIMTEEGKERARKLVDWIAKKGGDLGKWIKEQYENGALERFVEKAKKNFSLEAIKKNISDWDNDILEGGLVDSVLAKEKEKTEDAEDKYKKFLEERKRRRNRR